ncbi:unnamed protein product, partial [marine sediment metagenome]
MHRGLSGIADRAGYKAQNTGWAKEMKVAIFSKTA